MRLRHAYVHVPFCRHRCGYCDFTLVAGRDDLVERYLAALARELERVADGVESRHESACRDLRLELATLYLGGGTPSHLGPAGLRRLFAILHDRLRPVAGAEVSIEANPLDVTTELVAATRECGVTRVSLGSQSLDAATLRALDRDHEPDDVRRAVGLLRDAGLAVSLDLMTAAPGQSLAAVERDLAAALTLEPQHVSVYCLTWEPGTAFAAARRRGELAAAPEDLERRMFEAAIDRLTAAGFEHYEVSNFARAGHRCRHNEAYWDCSPWEAFGPGAARFDGRTRTTNHRSTTTWMNRVLAGAVSQTVSVSRSPSISKTTGSGAMSMTSRFGGVGLRRPVCRDRHVASALRPAAVMQPIPVMAMGVCGLMRRAGCRARTGPWR